ncbi:hypothetical protein LJ737_20790 [Hymenobacter sp. 15J16-1T3B]|uniref:hypothetical protein n=1 Tax=Hymenobacter sp. 15J16-1T3B TaxID=2886941 RepID=UPI001D12BA47|nr:hypothetical protein [Hymenobacter sp. 15J16-1T3B]MCC3159691.1 hypothetical protein [Hymenobacter sp. 15J16-1T3B]
MTPDEARARVEPLIIGGLTHPDYQRTVDLATLYGRLATGVGLENELRQYESRETEPEFKQRLRFTEFVTPSWWSTMRTPFYQVARLRGSGVVKRLAYEGVSDAEAQRRLQVLTQTLKGFYALGEVEDYLSETLCQTKAFTDPNAWLLTEFKPFDFRRERPRPYPVVVPCEHAVDFQFEAGGCVMLTVRVPVSRGNLQGFRYTVYLDNVALDYWPVLRGADNVNILTMPEGSQVVGTLTDDGGRNTWQLRILQHNAGRVPAIRIGYKPDEVTDGRTCVSPFEPAVPLLRKSLKIGSEADITFAQVAHPHKAQYVNVCQGDPQRGGCNHGRNAEGDVCGVCQGKYLDIQTSAADVLSLPLPPRPERADMMDLSKLVAFNTPPVDIPKLQTEYIADLKAQSLHAIFTSDVLRRTGVTQTATERMAEREQMNTALAPFAENNARLYRHIVSVAAAYADVAQGLDVEFRYPADLVIKTKADLYEEMAAAVKAQAAPFVIEQIQHQLAELLYADDPEALKRYKVKSKYITFIGLSETQFAAYAGAGYMTVRDRVLHTHADSIFSELEVEHGSAFYDLPVSQQSPLVLAKADEKVNELNAGATGSIFATRSLTRGTASAFSVGESVMVKPGMAHMPEHEGLTMTVAQVQGNTYAVKLPDGRIHKWYTADELMGMSPATKSAKTPAMAM